MRSHLRSLIARIEAWPVTPAQAVLTFLAIVLLRYGLESLLEARVGWKTGFIAPSAECLE
ncbi:MAG: hypothetical protein Q8O33_02585 [Pseudomonadota bacterium]|nr:hypothetical protein [Pseudomonadota bacterium]